ncbi:hypothetical protein [Burkholderia seminalis]|uniref:hypothetical protein n=1 Tax=Burkholderia seminalis TaxID=488731 RepID=UPI000F5B13BE|nr:hypothetical protein [Burkholderia seminalis]RQS88111.1 hypothetical protein DF048_27720 [Burkholderia seminalis]
MSSRRLAVALAIGATSTALCPSVLVGWQRGGSPPERLVWVAIGLVLVASAHLLPALIRDTPIVVRCIGSVSWGACLATACFGHAQFFVMAQQHAGEQRAAAVAVPAPLPSRSLTVIMAERASIAAQLATANTRYCVGNCATLDARRTTLDARLDALNAEADEVRRQQAAADRITVQRDALRVDPVTSQLTALLSTTSTRVDLLTGLAFAAVLEGVACLLWTVALRSPLSKPLPAVTSVSPSAVTATPAVTPPAVAPVTETADMTQPEVIPVTVSHDDETVSRNSLTPSHDRTSGGHAPRDAPVTSLPATAPTDDHLPRLLGDVAAGLVRPTVADIRRHLRVSQSRAAELRRQLTEHTSAA